MIIYDRANKLSFSDIEIFLTKEELSYMHSMSGELLKKPEIHHIHLNNIDNSKEITFALYSHENINEFDEESKILINSELKP